MSRALAFTSSSFDSKLWYQFKIFKSNIIIKDSILKAKQVKN